MSCQGCWDEIDSREAQISDLIKHVGMWEQRTHRAEDRIGKLEAALQYIKLQYIKSWTCICHPYTCIDTSLNEPLCPSCYASETLRKVDK